MSETNKDSVITKVINLRNESIDGWKQARLQSETVAKYLQHIHYSDAELKDAIKFSKPALRYNLLVAKLQTLRGNEANYRKDTQIVAQYDTQANVIKVLNDNYTAIKENENLEAKLSVVFADAICYPLAGWLKRAIVLDELGYPTFSYRIQDNFGVHPDPEFREFDLSDCQWIVHDEWMTIEQIKSKYRVTVGDKQDWWNAVVGKLDAISLSKSEDTEYKKGDRYLVCELQERVYLDGFVVSIDNSEEYEILSEAETKKLKLNHKIDLIKPAQLTRIHYTTVIPFSDDIVLLDKDYPYPTSRFSLFACFCYNINMRKSEQTSAMYISCDIQDRINKGMNQQVDYVTQMLGSPWHVPSYERTAIETLKTRGHLPGTVVEYTSANNFAHREYPAQVPAGILQTVEVDVSFLDSITHINPAMEGRSEKSGEANALYENKLNQSMTSINPYFEVLALYREILCNDYVELAPFVYSDDFTILPVKNEGSGLNYTMVNAEIDGITYNEIRTAKARASLDDGAKTKSALDTAFQENMAFANILLNSGAKFQDIPWDVIIRHSNMRDKEEFAKYLRARQQIAQDIEDNQRADAQMNSVMQTANAMQQPTQGV